MAVSVQRVFPANSEPKDIGRTFTLSRKLSSAVNALTLGQSGTIQAGERALINLVKLHNSSGGVITCGVGPLLLNAKWEAGQWDDSAAGNDYTSDTIDAQDGDADDFVLQSTTNNDGFVISSVERWSSARIVVTTAQVSGGGVVDELTYWTGSTWTTLSTLVQNDFSATGTRIWLFEPPADWANTSMPEGVPTGFAVRYRATTAPDTSGALARQVFVADPLRFGFFDVPSGEFGSYAGPAIVLGDIGESIEVAFGTANADNHALIQGEGSTR